MNKFAGVGLVNLFVILLFVWIMTVAAKTIFTMYPVAGLSEMVSAV